MYLSILFNEQDITKSNNLCLLIKDSISLPILINFYIQFLTLQEKNVYTEDEFDYWCRDGDLG